MTVYLTTTLTLNLTLQENDLSKHKMHSECYSLSKEVTDTIIRHKLASKKNRILTVGTTSTRVLESCAILRNNMISDPTSNPILDPNTSRYTLSPQEGETSRFIYPPYQFKLVDALLTNFHMPGLTPVMLVSAFAGHELTMKVSHFWC
jgi:S-adenosylmethionine:tRNA ribosyltransferase-isomerase